MALSGSKPQECKRLATLTVAALKLGWSVGRLRYYEARFRQELGCLRTPDGDPLFTDRQLQVLKNLHGWLQVDKAPDRLVRERLVALGRWMCEDLPLAPAPGELEGVARELQGPTARFPTPEVEAPPPLAGRVETLQGISARQGKDKDKDDGDRHTDPVRRGELVLLGQQLQDLTERIRGMEETLSALLSYLQEMRAPEASSTLGTPETLETPRTPSTLPQPSTTTPAEMLPQHPPDGSLIKHADAEARLAAGLISRWEAPELDSGTPPGAALRPGGLQAAKADHPTTPEHQDQGQDLDREQNPDREQGTGGIGMKGCLSWISPE